MHIIGLPGGQFHSLHSHRTLRRVPKKYHLPTDPADSGYSSLDECHGSPKGRLPKAYPSLDGPASSGDSDVALDNDSVSDYEEETPLVLEKVRSSSAPERSALDSGKHGPLSGFNRENKDAYNSSPSHTKRPPIFHSQTLDRFVPLRDHSAPWAEKYQTTRQAQTLSTTERLLRRDVASPDPFIGPRTPTVTNFPAQVQNDAPAINRLHRQGPVLRFLPRTSVRERQVSRGTVWTVGGLAPTGNPVDDGHGHLFRSGTHAQVFTSPFSRSKTNPQEDLDKYQGRIASALDIDRVSKVLDFDGRVTLPRRKRRPGKDKQPVSRRTFWNGSEWVNGKENQDFQKEKSTGVRTLPGPPFKVLDAPNLRDDFYCSVLAYSATCQTLAVGLGNDLYTWSEALGANATHKVPEDGGWITSVSFSSPEGGKSILGIGRADGSLILKSTWDSLPRFEVQQPYGVACLSWRPTCTTRSSQNPLNPGVPVSCEDLVLGDETSTLFYYTVEWPIGWEVTRDTWPGTMTLMAKISIHCQQICGLAWSPDGKFFASGGNDDICCLYDAEAILGHKPMTDPTSYKLKGHSADSASALESLQNDFNRRDWGHNTESSHRTTTTEDGTEIRSISNASQSINMLGPGCEKYCWLHGAAVKAIAFCPWRPGLVATGGGSNDKCIHFFHTTSGAALATIAVSAQVTSLVWSTTRREIAATFGYSQPEHPYRIAIFSWPNCQQVAAIPWSQGLRALYAIPYPASAADARVARMSRTAQEGCLVVAASDNTVKFHEVWARERKSTIGGPGTLGGSDILECLEGIDKEGDVIR